MVNEAGRLFYLCLFEPERAQSPRRVYWGSYRGATSQATSGKRLYRALCLVEYPGCSTAPVESRARSRNSTGGSTMVTRLKSEKSLSIYSKRLQADDCADRLLG